jgi:hypothetical protein
MHVYVRASWPSKSHQLWHSLGRAMRDWNVVYKDTWLRFRANLRTLRTREGVSFEAVAEASELDVRHWRRLEDGEREPMLETLSKVSAAFDLSFGDLLDREI